MAIFYFFKKKLEKNLVVTKIVRTFAPAIRKELRMKNKKNDAPVAQLVEHLTLNQGVQGSSPCGCTKGNKAMNKQSSSLLLLLKKT